MNPKRLRLLLGLTLAAGLVTALGAASLAIAQPSKGATCGAVAEGSITESTAFTQRAPGWGLMEHPILSGDAPVASERSEQPAGAQVDGLDRQLTLDLGGGGTVAYYGDARVSEETYASKWLASGGLQVERYPIDGTLFYEDLLAQFPDRATPVEVGPFKGALTWADPADNGVRTHNVYWSDGTYNFSLIADRSAARTLTLARSVACN